MRRDKDFIAGEDSYTSRPDTRHAMSSPCSALPRNNSAENQPRRHAPPNISRITGPGPWPGSSMFTDLPYAGYSAY